MPLSRFISNFEPAVLKLLTIQGPRLRDIAKQNASWSSRIPDAITLGEAKKTGNGRYEIEVIIDASGDRETGAPHALAFERGSGLKGPERDDYIIEPREGNLALVIPRSRWPKYVEDPDDELGGIYRDPIVLPYVWHPGVKPRPYMQPAVDSIKEDFIFKATDVFLKAITGTTTKVTIIDAKK